MEQSGTRWTTRNRDFTRAVDAAKRSAARAHNCPGTIHRPHGARDDAQRHINRTAGRDRLFQLDPLDRVYPLFGDSSTRFEAAQSNSKLYARVDRKRSFVMFGDFDTEMSAPLAGYSRKLTGVKAHLENSRGDSITLTGARPDTAFARDVFPAGSLGIMQLSNPEILPGSEVVMLEVRDRRNPELII